MLTERFWSKVEKTPACWVWLAARSRSGYGNFYIGRVNGRKAFRPAHRVAWEDVYGAVPSGLELDHLCRNRACINPDHLEAVTHQENSQRGLKGRMVKGCGVLRNRPVDMPMTRASIDTFVPARSAS